METGVVSAVEDFPVPNQKIKIEILETAKLIRSKTVYLFPHSTSRTLIISFYTLFKPDYIFQEKMAKYILKNGVPNQIITSLSAESIKFAGRTINLGPICHWEAPYNIQCPHLGQMNWSQYKTLKDAETARDNQMLMKPILNLFRYLLINFQNVFYRHLFSFSCSRR